MRTSVKTIKPFRWKYPKCRSILDRRSGSISALIINKNALSINNNMHYINNKSKFIWCGKNL